MGRGRDKAKQARIARELKYSTPERDISELEAELHASQSTPGERTARPGRDGAPDGEVAPR